MPRGYVPVEVTQALNVVDEYLASESSKIRSASQPRVSDRFSYAEDPNRLQSDRVAYHRASANAVRSQLAEILAW
jgi:hypothetical protein